MRDYIDLSSSPADEPCAQLGTDKYREQSRKEIKAYIGQLRRAFGAEPEGAVLKSKANPHDFGTYYSVVCEYDDANDTAREYAFKCEAKMPMRWDAEARQELGL